MNKPPRLELAGGLISAILVVLVGLWAAKDAKAQQKQVENSLSAAWKQGYMQGLTNGISADQYQVRRIANGLGPDRETVSKLLLAGLTNNPYVSK